MTSHEIEAKVDKLEEAVLALGRAHPLAQQIGIEMDRLEEQLRDVRVEEARAAADRARATYVSRLKCIADEYGMPVSMFHAEVFEGQAFGVHGID